MIKKIFFLVLVCSFTTLSASNKKYVLPKAEPSTELKQGLDAFVAESANVPLRSIIVLQHGKKVAEEYMNGATAETSQLMWSTSKTFTSFAIGFCIQEGRLSLDDKLIDLFPKETAAVLDTLKDAVCAENLKNCTVRDVLVMGCGHETDPTFDVLGALSTDLANMPHIDSLARKRNVNIVQEFFKYPFKRTPSSFNCYNSLGTYILSVIVTRITGKSMNDYLYPRLWRKIGIRKPHWDTLQGYDCGGWGLSLTTDEMARVGQMMLDKGRYAGRQVLPKDYLMEASTPFFNWDISAWIDPKFAPHVAIGYGYQIWRNADAFYASGHMGQYIYVCPELDAVIAVTGAFDSEAGYADGYTDSGLYVWRHIIPALKHDSIH